MSRFHAVKRLRIPLFAALFLVLGLDGLTGAIAGWVPSETSQRIDARDFLRESIAGRHETPPPDGVLESAFTWLPDQGLRGLYLTNGLTRGNLEAIIGAPMFLSGPHGARGMDFRSVSGFGHYNPEFLARLTAQTAAIIFDDRLEPLLRPFYEHRLQGMARAYLAVEQWMASEENRGWAQEIERDFQARLADGTLEPGGFGNEPYMQLLPLAQSLQEQGFDFYDSATAAGFWLRREMDGSRGQFLSLLRMVMARFDADYLASEGDGG